MGNLALAEAALFAVTAPTGYARDKGYCRQFVREVVEAVYGHEYDAIFPRGNGYAGSARRTALFFRDAGKLGSAPLQPGDILFKTYLPYGHVGILLADGATVAENSTTHWNGRDARGTRSLSAFGKPDIIGRLPSPEPDRLLILPGGKRTEYQVIGGKAWVELRAVAESLGAKVDTTAWPRIKVSKGAS